MDDLSRCLISTDGAISSEVKNSALKFAMLSGNHPLPSPNLEKALTTFRFPDPSTTSMGFDFDSDSSDSSHSFYSSDSSGDHNSTFVAHDQTDDDIESIGYTLSDLTTTPIPNTPSCTEISYQSGMYCLFSFLEIVILNFLLSL